MKKVLIFFAIMMMAITSAFAEWTKPALPQGLSKEDAEATVSVLRKMRTEDAKNASFSTPEDFTSYITNPSFEYGNLDGWTVNTSGDTGVKQNTGTYECSNADGDYLFNAFDNYKGYPISQRLENLPNGIYKLQGMVTSTTTNVYLFANGGMNDANGNKVNAHKAEM